VPGGSVERTESKPDFVPRRKVAVQIMGKCPKCLKFVTKVIESRVGIDAGEESRRGVSYVCPRCFTVLGVEADPAGLKESIVAELLRRLRNDR
jgi:hypothetical protein